MDKLEGGWKDGQQEEERGRDEGGMGLWRRERGLQGASSCRKHIMGGGRVGRGEDGEECKMDVSILSFGWQLTEEKGQKESKL